MAEDQARLWRPEAFKGIVLLTARFKNFAYSRHVHEEFGIGVVEQGTQMFRCHGQTHFAAQGAVISLNPDAIHDGRAATEAGYRYRMAYVPAEIILEALDVFPGSTRSPGYFRHPVAFDPELSQRLLHALRLMEEHPHDLLAEQSSFIEAIVRLFTRYAEPRYVPRRFKPNPAVVRKACDLIHGRTAENLSLQEIAGEVGVSRFHFLRLFKASTGLTPHEYLLLRRLGLAKSLIRQGHSLVRAAHEAGFADQSHMTRRFKAAYGVTPGQYRQALLA
ncbi:MAG: AraC family transcriptional regulator [bacterium]